MRLADYLAGRRKGKKCDVCGQKFDSMDQMEGHRREVHPNMPPKEKRSG